MSLLHGCGARNLTLVDLEQVTHPRTGTTMGEMLNYCAHVAARLQPCWPPGGDRIGWPPHAAVDPSGLGQPRFTEVLERHVLTRARRAAVPHRPATRNVGPL